MNKFIIIINLLLYGIVILCLYSMFLIILWKGCMWFTKVKKKKKPKRVKAKVIAKPIYVPPKLSGEQLGALSQIDAWKNQIVANREYIKQLEMERRRIKKSTITVEGSYNYTEVAKINKKIAAVESQSASIEMRLRKLAVKYNLQDRLETFDSDVV